MTAPRPKWKPGNTLMIGQEREEYDAIKRVHWSALRWMAKSPAHYRHYLAMPPKDTDGMRLGRAVHCAVLEPARFKKEWAVWRGGRRAGREWDAFCDENAGYEQISATEESQCLAVQAAVRSHPVASRYLDRGESEVAALWTHEEPTLGADLGFSTPCKGRLDYVSDFAGIVDLKTTRDASPSGFANQAWRFQMHVQGAFYSDGYLAAARKAVPYTIIAVETIAPFALTVLTMPERYLELGREAYRALLRRLDICTRENAWPAYSETPVELELPRWATFENDDEDLTGLDLVIGEQS